MCPACYAAAAIVAAKTASAGGVTAFVAAKVYKKSRTPKAVPQPEMRGNDNECNDGTNDPTSSSDESGRMGDRT